MVTRPRREFLRALALTSTIGLAGCQSLGQDTPTDSSSGDSDPTDDPTVTETVTETPTPHPEFKQNGTLYVEAADGPVGPDGFFDQGEQLDGQPDDYLLLETRENGEAQALTVQELREKYQFNQYQQLTDSHRIYRQFPKKLTDDEWVKQNIINPRAEEMGVDPIPTDELFQADKYTGEGDLKTRITESNYDNFWREVASLVLGGPSSTNDYIKTAALTGAEYHSAGRETATFNMKTNDGTHGLGFAITGATYDESELEQQETWGIETDPGEDTPVWDLDEHESYPNRDDQRIMIEAPNRDAGYGWQHLGMTKLMRENITIRHHKEEEFDEFLKNPDTQKGMKYIDSACILGHINSEAHERGTLPEFEDARVTVHPDRIEYRLNRA